MTEVRASHILVKTEQEANDLYDKIVSGKIDFADAAMEKSICPSGRAGGDLGFFGKGMMVKPFEDAAFSGETGKVSDPVKTQFGWHLIKVVDKK
jgi:peptidyl-prolyl cis-trans isomerase C